MLYQLEKSTSTCDLLRKCICIDINKHALHKYFTEINISTYVFYIYYIYVYIFMPIYIFKCTFRIINFSALSTLSITLENYKRNAVRFVSFIYIFYMPLKCYYICRAEHRAGLAGGRICVGVAVSRARRSFPVSHRKIFFYKSFPI